MMVSSNDLRQFAIEATDGQTGHCEDFYFDDRNWHIRYLVAQSGFLFNMRQSLIKSTLLRKPDIEKRLLPVSLSKDQIEDAEKPESHPPVSQQRRKDIRRSQFEHWPPIMIGAPGATYTPILAEDQLLRNFRNEAAEEQEQEGVTEDPHLRSVDEITGYSVKARDGDIGSISDFVFNPKGWTISFLVADIGLWLPGRQVVIKTEWVSSIDWSDQNVCVDVTKAEVEAADELSTIEDLERSESLMAQAPFGAFGF